MDAVSTVRAWEAKPAPTLAEQLRHWRCGRVGESWYVDETYPRVIHSTYVRKHS
jgi:transposase-like protein